jgi:hypothetical protein
MTLGPNWLTSWVKTNSKHVVYAPDKLEKNTFEKTSPTTASTANSSTGVDAVPRRDVDDARLSAVRNVGNRKNRRRMVKTRSVTDMIVEMANARNASNSDSETSVPKLTSATTKSDSSVATDTESTADLSPLQLVAGLFGASVDLDDDRMRPAQLPPYQPQTSKFINSKYLNEAAFILQREQKSLPLQQPKSHYAESSLVAERPTVAPRRSTRNEESFGSTKGHDSRPHVRGLANLKFLPQPFFGRADAEVQHTAYREPLESQLAAALDDLEYMRGVALSNEYTCQSCSIGETTNAAKPAALRSRGAASASLPEASKQLNEVISRHKKEVEQLTRERVSLCESESLCVITISYFVTRISISPANYRLLSLDSADGSKTFISSSTSLPTCAKI